LWKFVLLTIAGSTLWNTLFVSFGFFLGENWHVIEPYTNVISKVVYAIIALLLILWVVRLIRRERARRAAGLPDPDDALLQSEGREGEGSSRA
ncbi:MAG: DedA family protein, partial [Brachybacterium sp.]|nr:DedA family protein [Brachybacterium sp.]